MYDVKKIWEPQSLKEAINIMVDNEQAFVIAGGSDVLIKLREGHLKSAELVSIRHLQEFKATYLDKEENIYIGSGLSFAEVAKNDLVASKIPILKEAVLEVGGPQIRNIGTIGGNVCNGATSADSAPALFALNAHLLLVSSNGERLLPIQDFYLGPGRVSLQKAEILKSIMIKKEDYLGLNGKYIKYAMRRAMDIATLGCAVVLKKEDNLKVSNCRIAFGVAAPTPIRVNKTEAFLQNKTINEKLWQEVEEILLSEIKPRTSWRASKEFRQHIAITLLKRALTAIL